MGAGTVEVGGKPERWNLLVDRLQSLHLKLRQTSEGRKAITNLIDDENPTVRLWSAGYALGWSPKKAEKALEGLAEGAGLTSFSAKITLREFRSGKLKTDWVPKDR